jgi:hypothetical protein
LGQERKGAKQEQTNNPDAHKQWAFYEQKGYMGTSQRGCCVRQMLFKNTTSCPTGAGLSPN